LAADGSGSVDGWWSIAPGDNVGICAPAGGKSYSGAVTWRHPLTGSLEFEAGDFRWSVVSRGPADNPWAIVGFFPCNVDDSAPILLGSEP